MAPGESFPDMLQDVANLEGAYRMLNNERVTAEALQQPHRARTIERARQASSIVVPHDTSDVQTPWADVEEVGRLNTGKAGYKAHISLALSVAPDRPVRPLGVLSFEPVFRTAPPRSKSKKKHSGAETARWKNKEYARWKRGIETAGKSLAGHPSVIHVADREADCFELFYLIERLNQGFVIRLRTDRRARLNHEAEDEDEDDYDWSTLGKLASK